MKPLFELRQCTLSSGRKTGWRINFEQLDPPSVECFAALIAHRTHFGRVEGVPTGGLPLAAALERYADPHCPTLLIVDDVLTTGGSIRRHRNGRPAIGYVVVDRSAEFGLTRPTWVRALFYLESN